MVFVNKPREFYQKEKRDGNSVSGDDHTMVLYREVVPIDWEKVWPEFDLWIDREHREMIQQLVEAQLKGED